MKIELIPETLLRAIRQQMGSFGPQDTSFDSQIENLTIDELVNKWCGYQFGDEGYGSQIIFFYKRLEEIEKLNS